MRWLAALVFGIGLAIGLDGPAFVGHAQPTGAATTPVAGLATTLDAVFADRRLDGVVVGVTVRSAETGELLYDRAGNLRLVPGSNQKLISSAAALADLGPDYRFRTSVLASAMLRQGILLGDLYLRSGGGPTVTPAAWTSWPRPRAAG